LLFIIPLEKSQTGLDFGRNLYRISRFRNHPIQMHI
jgi:hypothetical protein